MYISIFSYLLLFTNICIQCTNLNSSLYKQELFLQFLAGNLKPPPGAHQRQLRGTAVHLVCQLLSFPFSRDVHEGSIPTYIESNAWPQPKWSQVLLLLPAFMESVNVNVVKKVVKKSSGEQFCENVACAVFSLISMFRKDRSVLSTYSLLSPIIFPSTPLLLIVSC